MEVAIILKTKEQLDKFIHKCNKSFYNHDEFQFEANAKECGFSFKDLGPKFHYVHANGDDTGYCWKTGFGLLLIQNSRLIIQDKKVYYAFIMPGRKVEEFSRFLGEAQSTFSSAKGWISRKNKGIKPIRGCWGKSEEECRYLLFSDKPIENRHRK